MNSLIITLRLHTLFLGGIPIKNFSQISDIYDHKHTQAFVEGPRSGV